MRSVFPWHRLDCLRLQVVLLSVVGAPLAHAAAAAGADSFLDEAASDSGDSMRRAGERLFQDKIAPIFAEHCLMCHSEKKSHGQLRLDTREGALRGGVSRGHVTEVDPAGNYLWERVTSNDEAERMPAIGPPLTEAEMADLGEWVRLSAPWPDASDESVESSQIRASKFEPLSLWTRVVLAIGQIVDTAMRYQPYFPLTYMFFALLWPIALVARFRRQRVADGEMWRARRWKLWLERAVDGHYYLASVAALVILALWLHIGVIESDKRRLDQAKQELADQLARFLPSQSPKSNVDTLVATFPKHPNRIGGTYYRGNDERSPELFNGGVYCTCKFHLELRGSDGALLHATDSVPAGPLSVRLEIERAPFAAKTLFSRHVISAVFLSRTAPEERNETLSAEVRPFATVVEGQSWEAYYPLRDVLVASAAQDFSGRVFLYNGGLGETVIAGSPAYSIDYKLQIVDGRLTADSDLRMGVIFAPATVVLTPPGMIPIDEWFSDRPLWEIVGGNSSDPKLLGITEHEEQSRTKLEPDPAAENTATGPE